MTANVENHLKEIESLKRNVASPNALWCYRGVPDEKYEFIPSAFRNEQLLNESEMFTHFQQKANGFFSELPELEHDPYAQLEYAQHFGIPTRLLDFTSSRFVALFFACDGYKAGINIENYNGYSDSNGAIWMLDDYAYKRDVFKFDSNEYHEDALSKERIGLVWSSTHCITSQTLRFPFVYKPWFHNFPDVRIERQASLLMAWGLCEESFDNIVGGVGCSDYNKCKYISQIIIPDTEKKSILYRLKERGISYLTLFPSLDMICESTLKELEYNREGLSR
jgi:hypothetical protein